MPAAGLILSALLLCMNPGGAIGNQGRALLAFHLTLTCAPAVMAVVNPFCPNFKHSSVVHGVEDMPLNMTEVSVAVPSVVVLCRLNAYQQFRLSELTLWSLMAAGLAHSWRPDAWQALLGWLHRLHAIYLRGARA